MKAISRRHWLIPASLICLSILPLLGGASLLSQLSGTTEILPKNEHFLSSPLSVLIHIFSTYPYCILGAFQFSTLIRNQYPIWHKRIGLFLIPSGALVASTGIWMTLLYAPFENGVDLLFGFRLLFGSAMLLSIGLSIISLRRKHFHEHGAWMIRAYALGLGAGTQAAIGLPWILIFGSPSEFIGTLIMGSGWVVNLLVAERIISKFVYKERRFLNYGYVPT